MKVRAFILIAVSAFLLCCASADGENIAAVHMTPGEEWSWNPGSYNLFSGEIDLSYYTGQDLMIRMTSDLSYGDSQNGNHSPLFTVINGERITMLQQTSTVSFTPDTSFPVLSFSGSIQLPEKGHVRHVAFQFHILNADGKEVSCATCEISMRDGNTGRAAGSFYFAFDINRITLIFGCAAALIWSVVLLKSRFVRNGRRNNMQRTGE